MVCVNPGGRGYQRAIIDGEQLTHRIVTLTGEALANPQNVVACLGTPISVARTRQPCCRDQQRVIHGGPMMGFAVSNLAAPVTKITNCLWHRRQSCPCQSLQNPVFVAAAKSLSRFFAPRLGLPARRIRTSWQNTASSTALNAAPVRICPVRSRWCNAIAPPRDRFATANRKSGARITPGSDLRPVSAAGSRSGRTRGQTRCAQGRRSIQSRRGRRGSDSGSDRARQGQKAEQESAS